MDKYVSGVVGGTMGELVTWRLRGRRHECVAGSHMAHQHHLFGPVTVQLSVNIQSLSFTHSLEDTKPYT